MARKEMGLVLMALVAGLVPACGDSDGEDTAGSVECCKVRAICSMCICTDGQITAGNDDHAGPCKLALDSWNGIGCDSCQASRCLSGC